MNIKTVLRKAGLDVRRAGLGQDPYADMTEIIRKRDPLVFDVGANLGQTIDEIQGHFSQATIHAFEPNHSAFQSLSSTHRRPRVHLNNIALGGEPGRLQFFEQSASDMSSFLKPGTDAGHIDSKVTASTDVDVSTIDDYCKAKGIAVIDILKSDTQGFDLEVLKGATGILEHQGIHAIYLEITFAKLYENLPRFDKIYGFIADHGFELVSFYKMWHVNGRAGWTDALFILGDSRW